MEYPVDEDDRKVEHCGFTPVMLSALKEHGVDRISHVGAYSRADLLSFDGIGESKADDIRTAYEQWRVAQENEKTHIIMLSGGAGSWYAGRRVVEEHGAENTIAMFADTNMEHPTLYDFLEAAVEDLGVELIKLEDGRTPWDVYFDEEFLGNSRVDICSRKLKREQCREYLQEHYNPFNCVCYLGIDWTEVNRIEKTAEVKIPWIYKAPLCEKPYIEPNEPRKKAKEAGLPEQKLYELGFPHNNCFHPDTEFITDKGVERLGDHIGNEVTVLGKSNGWKKAKVQSFGKQKLYRLVVERYGNEKTILTTKDHRWFVRKNRTSRKGKHTTELECGDRLFSMHAQLIHNVTPSPEGIKHGIIFGDGTRNESGNVNNPARIELCAEKDEQLIKHFPRHNKTEGEYGTIVKDLPRYYKELPNITESQSYLYGFLSGYFAADGTYTDQLKISSSERENLEFFRDASARVGISVTGITERKRKGYGEEETPTYNLRIHPSTVRSDFFLFEQHCEKWENKNHYRPPEFEVVDVEETDRVEEVVCAVVEDGGVFTLKDNILTGNCGGFCVRAGLTHFKHLYKTRPEVYKRHEQKEQEFREEFDEDVSILRKQEDGERRNITLKELREEYVENEDQSITDYDWGGCGCFSEME